MKSIDVSSCLFMRTGGLPHKNLIATSVIAFFAVLLVLFFTRGNETFFNERALLTQTLPSFESEVTDIDTDLDGLPDWKEKLYGTDYATADSDGDGTNDGDEVRVGRNPAVPNTANMGEPANDKLVYLEDPNIATSSTDLLGIKKEFFAKYLAEGSREIREETYRDLVKTVDAKRFAPRHELLGLNITSDNSAEGVKTYANAFGVIIKKYLDHRMERSEDDLIEAALTKKDKVVQEELQLFAIAYRNFAKDLLLLDVPSTLARAHLLVVNGYDGMATGLLSVATVQNDPVNGTAGYQAYLKYRIDVVSGYGMIVAHIANEHITFAANEPGYPFYWNTTSQR